MGRLAHIGGKRNFQLEGLECRQLLSVQTFTPPTASTALQSETVGKDGSLYFVEADQQQIGRILPSGEIIEYTVPDSFGDIGQLTTAKDGSIWFNTFNADSALLGHLTTDGSVTSVALYNDAISIGAANDGTIWFSTVENGIGRVSNKNAVNYYGGTDPSGYVTKIISGPAGSIYFIEVSKSTNPYTTPYLFSLHQASGSKRVRFNTFYSGNTTYNFDNITDIAAAVDSANNLSLSSDRTIWFYDGNYIKGLEQGTELLHDEQLLRGPRDKDPNFYHLTQISGLSGGPFPYGQPFFVDHTAGGKVYGQIYSLLQLVDLPAGGTPHAVISGGNNTVWVTDETKGLIYKVTLDDNLSETTPVGLAGHASPKLKYNFFGNPTITGSEINLTFNNTSTLYDTIQVLRSSTANGKYSVIGSVSGGAGFLSFANSGFNVSFKDSNVRVGTSYFYKLRSTLFNAFLDGPLKVTADKFDHFP